MTTIITTTTTMIIIFIIIIIIIIMIIIAPWLRPPIEARGLLRAHPEAGISAARVVFHVRVLF